MLTAAPVAVIGITPTTGPSAGGTPVTITGMGLTGATAVMFGTTAASNVVINSNMQITATSPRGASGRVDVTVVTPSGSSAISSADQFIYQGVSTAPGVTPTQMRDAYGVDSITIGSLVGDGAGQTIAIIGEYDDPDLVSSTNPGFSSSDLHLFDEQMGLPDPPSFLKLDQDGGTNYPSLAPTPTGTSGSWSSEECLDVESAHVIAPEANIVLFEANSPAASDQLGVAVNTAKNYSGVSVVSMSFGWPGGFPGDTSYDSSCFVTPSGHNGVTFVASTGDNGPPGDYAAFSPNVVAVGGTTLTLGAGGSGYGSEAAWSSSGGGQATDEPEPAYQEGVQSSGYREIPDVSMDGDRTTGVACYDSYDYGSGTPWVQTGGTSLSAPMFAGLLAIADQLRVAEGGTTLDGPSQTLPYLYQLGPSCYHDITSGNITSGNGTYNATVGYDMATGIGTPIANVLVLQLAVYGIKTVYGITTTALTSSNAFSTYGQTVTFTATVTPWSGSGPTGTIQFQIDGTSVGSPVTLSGGMAAYSTTLTPGNHTILAIYSGDSNFSGSRSATFSEVVGKATPTFTWASPGTITYGTALSNTQLDAAASWIVGGSSVPVAGTFTYGPGIGTVLSAGNNQLLSATDFVPSDTTDYNSVAYPVTTEINVNKATPTFTWATPGTITYGTALSATQLDAAASWIVGGSIVPVAGTFTYGPGIGTVLSAGNNEPLSATNFVPSDTTDYNSVANPVTTAINVNKATPTFTWATPAAITFGTALSNTQLDAAGSWIVGGSIVPVAGTFTYGPGIGTVLSAGNNQPLSATNFAPSDTTDYNSVANPVATAIKVNKATPTFNWATPGTITFGTALSNTQLDAAASWIVGGSTVPVAGTFTYSPGTGTVLSAGNNQPLSATNFAPSDTADYNSVANPVATAIDVNKATPTVTASNANTTYTGLPLAYPGSNVTVTGANGLSNSGGTLSCTYNGSATVPTTAGSYTLVATFTPSDATDYATASGTATWTINRATPTVAAGNDSTTYTGSPLAYRGSDVSVAGVNGLTKSGGTLSYTYNGSATVPTTAGTYTVVATFTPNDATDYASASGTATWTIGQATPMVTASNDSTTYTGSPLAYPGGDVTVTGANGLTKSGGSLSYTYNGVSTAPTTAGSYAVVATFTPSDAINYTSATGDATWTIGKATPAVTADNANTTYTGLPQTYPDSDVNVAGANGLSNSGGTLGYTYNGSATVPTTAGTYAVVASFTPTDTTDYASSTGDATWIIKAATPMVTASNGDTTYTGAPQTYPGIDVTVAGANGLSNSGGMLSYTYNGSATVPIAAGSYAVAATFKPTDATDYASATGTATWIINKAPLIITAAANTKTYDGTTSAAAVPTVSGLQGSDTVTGLAEAYSSKNAGTDETLYVTACTVRDGDGGGNYSVILANNTSGVVNARPITVTAGAYSKIYDGTTAAAVLPKITAGTLASGDTPDFSEVYNNRNVGTGKTLMPVGSVSDGNNGLNYDVSYVVNKSGVITVRPITVTAVANTKSYDGTTAAALPAISGGSGAGDTAAFTETYNTKNVGTKKKLTPAGVVDDGNGGHNYKVTFVPNSGGVITARAITVTAAANTKTYDRTTSATATPTITSGSLAAGDTAKWSETYATKNAGTNETLKPAGSINDGNGGKNYIVTFVSSTNGAIAPRPITVTAAANTKTYDGTTSAKAIPTITSGSLVAGDTAKFTESYDTKNVGANEQLTPAAVVNDGNGGNNYAVTLVANGEGAITSRAITVTAAACTKTYDGTTSATAMPRITSGSLAAGDTAKFTETYDTKNVGTKKNLTPTGIISDGNGGYNYAVTFVPNTKGVIAARTLTVTAAGVDKPYDGTTAATVTLSDNAVPGDSLTATYTTAKFTNPNPGTWTVTVTGITISGADAANYKLANTTATTVASITPAQSQIAPEDLMTDTAPGSLGAAAPDVGSSPTPDTTDAALLGIADGWYSSGKTLRQTIDYLMATSPLI